MLFYSLPEVGQKQTSEAMYLLRYIVKGTIHEVQDKNLIYHFNLSTATYKCSKIITNKMTLMDYPLFQG